MELRHLRYFVAAAEEQHFGRAAHKLHVTRPAVSKLLGDLEDELGMLLFERKGHRVSLTPAGRQLLPDIQSVMHRLGDAFAAAKDINEGKSGKLSIGYGTLTLHNALFRASIKQFKQSHPGVALQLVELPTLEQPKALADGRIQAGFMHFGPLPAAPARARRAPLLPTQDPSSVDWHVIETGHLGVVMEKGHALARCPSLTVDALAHEGFIVVPNSNASPGYGMLYSLCQVAGFEPQVVQEVNSVSSMLNLVSVGMGVGLCVMGDNFAYPPPLRTVPLRQVDYCTRFALGWLKGQRDPLVDAFLDVVKSVAKP